MAITKERLPGSRVSLQIEVEPDRLEASMSKAVRRISQQVRIPGFRPGKAPRAVVERHVGQGAILQEALDELIPEVYNEALETEQIDAIAQPEFDLKSMDPLVVAATVPVRPEVDLNDYQSLRAPKPEVEVTEEQVQETLTNIRRRFATLEPVDRPVEWNDTVRADVTVAVEGQEPHEEEDAEFALREDGVVSLPGFAERLIGLERGGPYTIEFDLPEDFQPAELAGKHATYTVTIHDVKQEVLPELDDEFAVSLDEGFEDAAALERQVRDDLRTEIEREAEASYHDEIVDLLVANAELDYPDVLVDREVDRMIDQQSNHASHTPEGLQQWLQAIGQTEEQVREALRESADLNVRRALALGEFVRVEEIEVADDEVDAEVERIVDSLAGGENVDAEQRRAVRQLVDTEEGRSSMRNQLLTRRAIERLAEICSQAEDDGEQRRRGSRRRRGRSGEDEAGDEPRAEAQQDAEDDADESAEASSEASTED